jgi:hypothetical protein
MVAGHTDCDSCCNPDTKSYAELNPESYSNTAASSHAGSAPVGRGHSDSEASRAVACRKGG